MFQSSKTLPVQKTVLIQHIWVPEEIHITLVLQVTFFKKEQNITAKSQNQEFDFFLIPVTTQEPL